MFATLLGSLPRPGPDLDQAIEVVVRAQEDAGFEPVTDGRLRDPEFERLGAAIWSEAAAPHDRSVDGFVVDGWRFAAGLTHRAVKQALPGPYTLGRRLGDHGRASEKARLLMGSPRGQSGERLPESPGEAAGERAERTLHLAEALRGTVDSLAAAGCPLVEIEELDAHLIGDDAAERGLFADAHRRLADGVTGTHLSLSIVGGSAAGAGIDTILGAPYASLAVDLIAGPDNWNLVTHALGDRGVIAGVLSAGDPDEPREVMLWAAHYAASSGNRGLDRVGLGSAGSWAGLTWEVAMRKMRRLGDATRLAGQPPSEDLARSLDPRAVSSRRAALGHGSPPPRRRRT